MSDLLSTNSNTDGGSNTTSSSPSSSSTTTSSNFCPFSPNNKFSAIFSKWKLASGTTGSSPDECKATVQVHHCYENFRTRLSTYKSVLTTPSFFYGSNSNSNNTESFSSQQSSSSSQSISSSTRKKGLIASFILSLYGDKVGDSMTVASHGFNLLCQSAATAVQWGPILFGAAALISSLTPLIKTF